MNTIVIWAGILGSIFGVVTSVCGLIALYRGSIRKGYAAERDFNHVKESLKALSTNLDFLTKELEADVASLAKDVDNRCDRIDQNLTEIKALQLSTLGLKTKPRNDD